MPVDYHGNESVASLPYQVLHRVQEVIALGKFLAHTIRQQRVHASECALDVYALAKRLAGRKDGAELKPFVEDMREKLGKKATRKTNSDPVPAPASFPPAPPRKV